MNFFLAINAVIYVAIMHERTHARSQVTYTKWDPGPQPTECGNDMPKTDLTLLDNGTFSHKLGGSLPPNSHNHRRELHTDSLIRTIMHFSAI